MGYEWEYGVLRLFKYFLSQSVQVPELGRTELAAVAVKGSSYEVLRSVEEEGTLVGVCRVCQQPPLTTSPSPSL